MDSPNLDAAVEAAQVLYLAEVGPTDSELALLDDASARSAYWREVLHCPDGYLVPHDGLTVPDPQWRLVPGPRRQGDVLVESKVMSGQYDWQGSTEPTYQYYASEVVRKVVPVPIDPHRLTAVEDVRRVEYWRESGGIEERCIPDYDEAARKWTNASRGSYHTTWQPDCVDGEAMDMLRKVFAPMAARFGLDWVAYAVEDLIRMAEERGLRQLGEYREKLGRKPYPGEAARGITEPSIRVRVYQRPDGMTVLVKDHAC